MSNGDLPHDPAAAVWARLGELMAEVRNGNRVRDELKAQVERMDAHMRSGLHDLRNQLTPLVGQVERHNARLDAVEELEARIDAHDELLAEGRGMKRLAGWGWVAVTGGIAALAAWFRLGGGGGTPPIAH